MSMNAGLVSAELWGGPLDGEWVECFRDRPVTAFWDAHQERFGWTPYVPTQCAHTEHWRIAGFYDWTGEQRLAWCPS